MHRLDWMDRFHRARGRKRSRWPYRADWSHRLYGKYWRDRSYGSYRWYGRHGARRDGAHGVYGAYGG